jgi:hypothetical protein
MNNIHFKTAHSWSAAREMLAFDPLKPEYTAGLRLHCLRIHVCDHKLRELPISDRTLEAYYGHFVFSQARKGEAEAQRLASDVRYGSECTEALIAGRAARVYELGPEPEPDDIDGRSPSVVTWHDAEMFYLIASDRMFAAELVRIAHSLYATGQRSPCSPRRRN